ncbi:MAG: DEAD/DEAH box helicase [Myxococcales bacterium]|nr:DEAD/DEAH box helicase [Myxococcales bacterium]
MEDLLEAIREQCSPAVWRRAQALARSAQVNGKRTHNDELELRVRTRSGMVSPLVVLSPRHTDWSCDCDSNEDACIHVAAGALWLQAAHARGEDLHELSAPVAKLAYRLRRSDGALALERHWRRAGGELEPLERRLCQLKSQDGELSLAQADLEVDVALGSLLSGKLPRPLVPRVLSALAECDDVQLDGRPVQIGPPVPLIQILVSDRNDGFHVVARQDPAVKEIFDNGAVLHGRVLRPVGELDLSGRDVEELRKGKVYGFGEVADLVGRVLPALQARVPVDNQSRVLPQATPMKPRLLVQTEYDGLALQVLPVLVYGDPPSARLDGAKLHYLGGKLPMRDERREKRLIAELEHRAGMRLGRTEQFVGLQAVSAAERLRRMDFVELTGNGLDACFVAPELQAELDFSSASGLRFFSMDGPGGGKARSARPEAVVAAFQRGESLVPLVEGGWAALPADFLQQHGHLVADLVAAAAEREALPDSSLPDLARLCEALEHPPPPRFGKLRALVDDFEALPPPQLPTDLRAELRSYQQHGVRWLSFLSEAGLGAMLADDMGLGKTLQALCAITTPTLVVCPASVMYNWEREIERFRPSLRVNRYHGPGRTLDMKADVTLTTYAVLRIDSDKLAAEHWDTVVIDEAQYIKNADSQVARAAFELDARFRMTLTGTPVENRLDELWSQFHFLNPGLLGGRRDFDRRYGQPIAAGDAQATAHLRSRLKPFLLRRMKREVEAELPPRTDVVLRCSLGDHERALYDAVKAATQKEVLQQLSTGGSVLAALEALLRLRQACCHPALLPGQQDRPGAESSKLQLLMATLTEALDEDHKALVFSQWTSLLDLVEPLLHEANVPFCRLDGRTRDRGEVVERFQSNDGPPVMLVSLKAGGTGLNLTAADHVFLLDPWWNPAVEDQAADRAHRIGQQRPVLVHRLVAESTVEEGMLELQERKRALAQAATGGPGAAGGITREDLLALLS